MAVLLVFLALSDSHFALQEKAVVWDLVRKTAERLNLPVSALDTEVVAAALLEVIPTRNLVTRAMNTVLDDETWRERLPKLMTAMVMADGTFVADERAALEIIKDALLKQRAFGAE